MFGARRIYSKLNARIAVSEAAEWTARRYYGGRYRIVPNGVDLSAARPSSARPNEQLHILFIGRAEGRKGLPVLLRAFEALRGAGVDARLTVAGATELEVEPLLLDTEGVEIAGRVTEEEKWRLLGEADLLCAPSLGGESFGMVLTEAFASSTPVVGSRIAGYRDVVRSRQDGLLVPPGDAVELGEALRDLALDPERRAVHGPLGARARRALRLAAGDRRGDGGLRGGRSRQPRPADPRRPARPQRRPHARRAGSARTPAPAALARGRRRRPPRAAAGARLARRGLVLGGALAGVGLTALALDRIGLESIARSLLAATPIWVLVAFALMCASMLLRAEAWHAILCAALPGVRVRRRDTARGTMIGVLMSATMPARLGEPSRALIVARRLGRMRDRFPVVLGTIVSQTLLNILALVALGAVMFATVGIFRGREDALVIATVAPLVLLALVIATPWLLRRGKPTPLPARPAGRRRRARRDAPGAHGLQVFRRPKLGALGDASCSSPRGRSSGSPATCCWWRSASTSAPGSAPRRPCCSPST